MNHILKSLRKKRNFNVSTYIKNKITAINNFFTEQNLDSAVLGISGGIDSAVTFALLVEASKQDNSPIKKILPLTLPISNVKGVTGQEQSIRDAFWSTDKFVNGKKVERLLTIELNEVYNQIVKVSLKPLDNVAWAEGQMASVLRTPLLYYHAAILQTFGFKSIVVGTTNRDEGSYIGFFGKASDGMVDLQPIADIHKSEVYQVAKYFGIDSKFINKKPKGDVWDGKCDEEMIGATYDELELFLLAKDYNLELENNEAFKNIEKLHTINKHKYVVGSPAHFIDVMPRQIKGGW